jgi:hypothetical protein
MHPHGDPVRFSAFAFSGITTSVALAIYAASSNVPYNFLPTDYLVIDNFTIAVANAAANSIGAILNTAGGSASASSSTILSAFGVATTTPVYWGDSAQMEGMSGQQGVIPSVFVFTGASGGSTAGSATLVLAGTGRIIHSPGYSQPWAAPGTPNV